MKTLILLILLSSYSFHLFSQSNPANWTSVDEDYPFSEIYVGAGFYYDVDVFTRVDQELGFNANGLVYTRAEVKYGTSSSWEVLVNNQAGTGLIIDSHPWTQPGEYELTFKLWLEDGTSSTHVRTVYVMPKATLGFIDNSGNRMIVWGTSSTINDPYFLIEGFDPTNENNANLYYAGALEFVNSIRANGGDFIVFQFADGGGDMYQNATKVKQGIQYINSLITSNIRTKVIGVSMGGVIGRYVLAKAEEDNIDLNVSHFISLDAPQTGAILDSDFLDWVKAKQPNNPGLNSQAAKQLLRYNPFDVTGSIHQSFYQNLNSINGTGYPATTTNIAVSFSPSTTNNRSGLWLKMRVAPNPSPDPNNETQNYYLGNNEDIDVGGSYLPLSSTQIWGRSFGVTYEAIRYNIHPTFIPHESALHFDNQGNSKFDQAIMSESYAFHDEVPNDVILQLLIALDINLSNLSSHVNSSFNAEIKKNFTVPDNRVIEFNGETKIEPGVQITLGKNSKIIFKGGVSAIGTQANPITFKSTDPNNTNVQYDQVLFDNDWNGDTVKLEWCIFEGGFYNARFIKVSGGLNGSIKNSTFRKGGLGLYVNNSDIDISDVLIEDNTSHGFYNYASGVYIDDSKIINNGDKGILVAGQSQFSSVWQYVSDTIIENNNSSGIYVNSDAYIDIRRSRVKNNGGHEIYASYDAILALGRTFGSNLGQNAFFDSQQGYGAGKRYIYKAALTSNGENQTSPRTYAQKDYWGSSTPSSNMFYGDIFTSPYLSSDPTTGLNPGNYPSKANPYGGLTQTTTASINQAIGLDKATELKSSLIELRNSFTMEEDVLKKIAIIKSMRANLQKDKEGIANELPEYERLVELFREEIEVSGVMNSKTLEERGVNGGEDVSLAINYLKYFDLKDLYFEKKFKEVTIKAEELITQAVNQDLIRSLLLLKLYAHESLSEYTEALLTLEKVESLKPDLEMAKGTYQPMDFSFIRFDLQEHAGLKPDRTPFLTPVSRSETTSDSDGDDEETKPESFALHNSYPNPFNPSTNISFDLPENSFVEVEVFDINGRLVSVLARKQMNEGTHTLRFDASGLASGLYIIRARLGNTQFFDKITLIK